MNWVEIAIGVAILATLAVVLVSQRKLGKRGAELDAAEEELEDAEELARRRGLATPDARARQREALARLRELGMQDDA